LIQHGRVGFYRGTTLGDAARILWQCLRMRGSRRGSPEFLASLPVAGADGTLNERMKEPPLTGKIHAKTGSVTHVRTLSGLRGETPAG